MKDNGQLLPWQLLFCGFGSGLVVGGGSVCGGCGGRGCGCLLCNAMVVFGVAGCWSCFRPEFTITVGSSENETLALQL